MSEFHTAKAFAREEPRVELIESMLRSLLDVVDLEFEGRPVRVDGFRLRNLDDWRTVRETSLQTNLGSFSTACNCKCAFCYEEGNPKGLFEKQPRFVSMSEARTRFVTCTTAEGCCASPRASSSRSPTPTSLHFSGSFASTSPNTSSMSRPMARFSLQRWCRGLANSTLSMSISRWSPPTQRRDAASWGTRGRARRSGPSSFCESARSPSWARWFRGRTGIGRHSQDHRVPGRQRRPPDTRVDARSDPVSPDVRTGRDRGLAAAGRADACCRFACA